MSTPTFTSSEANLDVVRLYTEFDPYYYTIDNRPLEDLKANIADLADSSDAARRATLIEAVSTSSVLAGLLGTAQQLVGLRATATTANTLTVSPGAMLTLDALSAGDSTQVTRIAASPTSVVLNCPAPVTLGREYTYIVQAKFTDLVGSVTHPNYDPTNAFLPSTLISGSLSMNIIVGTEANTGTSVAPTVTPGWTALYQVVNVSGAALPVISIASGSFPRTNMISTEEFWVAPTLTNSWINLASYQPVQYKRVGNRVLIRGAISSGTAGASAFTLPVGYRPLVQNAFPVGSGAATNLVTVTATGTVLVQTSASVHLGLIEFWLD